MDQKGNKIGRKDFLKQMTTLGAGIGIAGSKAPFLFGDGSPNEKVVMGIIGTHNRGSALARGFARLEDAEIAYIADVDDQARAKGVKAVHEGGQQKEPQAVNDFRRILDDKSVDAVAIATPDHWHTPAAILAMKAGKHVYVEKPCAHNPREGKLLVEAAQKYGKQVQMGDQRRSWPHVIEGINKVREGAIGRAYFARTWYSNTRKSIGKGKTVNIPSGLDYELWQGPAPRQTYRDNTIPYNWHWFWDWGTGEIGNNGTHFIDLARWGLNVDYPIMVSSNGGRYAYDDDWETPDTQVASYNFEGGKTISWESRSCNGRDIEGIGVGAEFFGTEGSILIHSNGYTIFDNDGTEIQDVSENSNDELTNTGPGFDRDAVHFKNFTGAIRKGVALNSPIDDANISVLLIHLGNIAYRTESMLHCDPRTGEIVGNPEAMKFWGRQYEPGWWVPKL